MSKNKQKNIIGTYKTHFNGKDFEYQSFTPSIINKQFVFQDNQIALLLEKAGLLLGELNAYSTLVPDVDFFIQMHVIKEATKSSRIEGTRTNIDEAVLPEVEINPEKHADWEEVHKYIQAINYSVSRLKDLPLSVRLIKEGHKILLSGVRGKEKQPGEIRTSQNWIGGSNIQDAIFIPPDHTELPELLGDLEKFWHNDKLHIPQLVKIALGHYQFETIHPFLDGNGRMGRLLITLQLVNYGILQKPTLYISDFFERNRNKYYNALTNIRNTGNLEEWLCFFLTGVIQTAKQGKSTFEDIIALRQRYDNKILTFGRRAKLGQQLLLHLFSQPVISIKPTAEQLGITYNTLKSLISIFMKEKLLHEITGFSRNKLFILKEYVEIFKK